MMKKLFILTSILIAFTFVNASATIINVPADYDTIQVAINASSDGDTVLVADGHYYERINFYGKGILLTSEFMLDGDTIHIQNTIIDADTLVLGVADTGSVVCFVNSEDSTSIIQGFSLQNGIGTISGYYPDGGGIFCYQSSPNISNNSITGNSTGIDGSGGGICCREYSSPSIQHNTISENSTDWYGGGISCYAYSSPTISNNTITGNSADHGGGIHCYNNSSPTISNNTISENYAVWGGGISCSVSSPTISNNTISGNSTDWYGGGIECFISNPFISNNTITGNSADDGGGIDCDNSNPTISNNTITGNSANNGGGISCSVSSPTISNNTITGNSAYDYGGGICCIASSPIISNNTISENSANGNSSAGGGIFCWNSSSTISNNTISGNSAGVGGGISCGDSNPVVINTILWANIAEYSGNEIYLDDESSISITYSDIQDTLWPGEGNIDADPLFRDPDNGDFHLMATYCGDPYDSPCIDAGHPDSSDAYLDCQWGLGAERSDMGAYGGNAEPQTDIREQELVIPRHFILMQNYPNPFNASTTIKYTLQKDSDVIINIYDLLGRKIGMLVNEKQQAGVHQTIWNADKFSSGVYFYRIQASDYTETKKMVLLK